MGDIIGKVHATSKNEVNIEWVIENNFTFPMREFLKLNPLKFSPKFYFESQFWHLKISQHIEDNVKYNNLSLVRNSHGPPTNVDISVAVKTVNGEKYKEKHCTKVFEDDNFSHMLLRFKSKLEDSNRQSELVPSGVLTVVCTLKNMKTTEIEGKEATAKCSFCGDTVYTENISAHKKTCKDRPIKCPRCLEVVQLQHWCDHKCKRKKAEGYFHEKTEFLRSINRFLSPHFTTDTTQLKRSVSVATVFIIVAILTARIYIATKRPLPPTHPCTCTEGVTEALIAEVSKGNQSDVAKITESKVSSSNQNEAVELNKGNRSHAARINESKVSSSNQNEVVETDESESLPQPVLIVRNIGSTYLEVHWVLPENSKASIAQYGVYFRKSEAKRQKIAFLDASQTSYNLTKLDPGVSYQIYIAVIGPTGISRSSEIATVRTSSEATYHDEPEERKKQPVAVATVIIIFVIVAACVYAYSKTPLPPTHSYREETMEISTAKVNDIKDDITEIAESKASCSNKTGVTETEESVSPIKPFDNHGIVTDINHLLKERRGIDVTFVLETPSGKKDIFAHQLILSVMSSYFEDKFYGKQRNKEYQIIPLKGVDPKVFEEIIRYCYGWKPDVKTTEEVCALFKLASQFKVISLLNLCCTFFKHTKIQPGNVFSALEISEKMEDTALKNMCYKILEEKTGEVLASYEIHNITPAMMHIILDLRTLSFNSEYELIKWFFDWAKAKSEEQNSICKSSRGLLENLLQGMNFLSLTAEEFAMLCKENPEFFNLDEIASISLNIGLPGTREMPDWYNKHLKMHEYTGSTK